MLERVVFRDGTGMVRHCAATDWDSHIEVMKREKLTVLVVELCRVSSREEAMRLVNLARDEDD